MRLSPLVTFLAAGLSVSAQDCWSTSTTTCRNAFADQTVARNAIAAACNAMPTCKPGTTVTGKVPGYTATLRLGTACAGLNPWSPDACITLFEEQLFPQCKTEDSLPYPGYPPKPFPPVAPTDYPLASKLSTCDNSWLSFNLGG